MGAAMPSAAYAARHSFSFSKWSPRGDAANSGRTVAYGSAWMGGDSRSVKFVMSNSRTQFLITTSGDYTRAKRVSRNTFFRYMRQTEYFYRECFVDWRWRTSSTGNRYRYVDRIIGGIMLD
jgi:hypothetical protein